MSLVRSQADAPMKDKIVLAIGAHPDDIDFGASGTVAKLVDEGWEAYYVVCTDGSKGSSDPEMTSNRLIRTRRNEQVAAGKVLGLKDVIFLDHPDTQLEANQTLKEELVRIIRQVRPSRVIGLDPTFYFSLEPNSDHGHHTVNHTDHRAAGTATMDAVFPLSRDRLTFPQHEKEGLAPHRVEELWIVNWGDKSPCHFIDITDHLERKLKAIEAHCSQYPDFAETKKKIKERALRHAKGENYTYAESFLCLKMSK